MAAEICIIHVGWSLNLYCRKPNLCGGKPPVIVLLLLCISYCVFKHKPLTLCGRLPAVTCHLPEHVVHVAFPHMKYSYQLLLLFLHTRAVGDAVVFFTAKRDH